jgi:D-alanine-D-alanine ligase
MSKIGLFFGGLSNEAWVSCQSARNVAKYLDRKRHDMVLVYWHTDGRFYRVRAVADAGKRSRMTELPEHAWHRSFDIALPMTHGKFGEDGALQSLFEMQKIPYCGCRVLSSSLCMDKALFKTILANAGIPQARFSTLDFHHMSSKECTGKIRVIRTSFALPVYCKPANSGSSVGITRVDSWKDLPRAITKAKKHDSKVVLEEGFVGHREMEVAIVGTEELTVSDPGELILAKEFYDYDDKYKKNKTKLMIPATVSPKIKRSIKDIATRVYRLCDCSGFARIDFFIGRQRIFVNEVNTLPGFTDISMFPLLMIHSGLTKAQLIDKIISLAY